MMIDSFVSAEERDRAVRFLGHHRDAGGLDASGHAERVTLAGAARTPEELYALFEDLPKLTHLPADEVAPSEQATLDADPQAFGRNAGSSSIGGLPGLFGRVSPFGRDRPRVGLAMSASLTVVLFASMWGMVAVPLVMLWGLTYVLFEAPFWPRSILETAAILMGALALVAWIGDTLLDRYGLQRK